MPKWSLDQSPALLVTHDAPRALVKQPDFDLKPIRGALRPGMFPLDLNYLPVGRDPLVGGRISSEAIADLSGCTVEFVNATICPPWSSGKIRVSNKGFFQTELLTESGVKTTFQIEVRDASGALVTTDHDHLTYRFVDPVTEQPLLHSVGVALANNEMEVFSSKGTQLPARHQWTVSAVLGLKKDAPESLMRIRVLEGENKRRADRNLLIGVLEIKSSEIKRDLPPGSDVDFLLDIDQSRCIRAEAYIPFLDQEVAGVLTLSRVHLDLESMRKELEVEKARIQQIRKGLEKLRDPAAASTLRAIDEADMIQDVENALAVWATDEKVPYRCQKNLVALQTIIDAIADSVAPPDSGME